MPYMETITTDKEWHDNKNALMKFHNINRERVKHLSAWEDNNIPLDGDETPKAIAKIEADIEDIPKDSGANVIKPTGDVNANMKRKKLSLNRTLKKMKTEAKGEFKFDQNEANIESTVETEAKVETTPNQDEADIDPAVIQISSDNSDNE